MFLSFLSHLLLSSFSIFCRFFPLIRIEWVVYLIYGQRFCHVPRLHNPNVSRFRLAHLLDYSKSFSPFNRFLIFQVFSHLKTINTKLNGFLLGGLGVYVLENQRMSGWFDVSIEIRPLHFANDDQK